MFDVIRPAATRRRPSSWLVVPLVGATLLSGCTGADPEEPASTTGDATSSASATSPSATPTPAPPSADAGAEIPLGDGGPEAAFQTWLAASRAPDAALACDYMSPELAQRMVDEMSSQGVPGVSDCPSMIELTAGLYAMSGQSAETLVELREQMDDRAVLHVTYVAGKSCGLVVMRPGAGHWVLDERSKEEC